MAKPSSGGARRYSPISDNKLDRVLAAMIVGIIVLSVIAIIIYMIGTSGGWLLETVVVDGEEGKRVSAFGQTVWAVFFVGLPIAIVLMVTVTIRIGIRRSRDARKQ